MDKYTKLSPEMQELWDEDMKRVKEELEKLDYKQLFKVYGFEVDEIKDYTFEMEYINYYDEEIKEPSTTDQQITILKSQLKHCKNPLQKLNLEREMNRLIREKERRSNHESRIRRN